ncbi:MAG: sulfatase-like hydrolase/transferase [Deltaproteobacteria bacterium]|nr:sulfatase-like hydrolase/transferase [Deltaproteobacteria bacterium]
MLDRRKRTVRRAMIGGVTLAVAGVLPLWLMELVYVLLVRRPTFDSIGQGLLFGVLLLLIPAALAVFLGAIEGAVVLAVSRLTGSLAKRRVAEPHWMACLYTLLLAPPIALVAALTFAGRRARELPGRHLLAAGLGLVGIVACYGAMRLGIWVRDRFRVRRWGSRPAYLIAPLLLLLALGLYVADQLVLPGLYPFFHVSLAVTAVVLCQLAVAVAFAVARPNARWMGRVMDPGAALLLVVATIAGGAWGLKTVARWEQLRFLIHEHTAVQAKIVRLAARAGLVRGGADSPPRPVEREEAPARVGLRPGPRRPDHNLLLISVDALRADHMGVYGYRRRTTPELDAWARSATVFERGYAPVPHTSFSLTSLLTGTHIAASGLTGQRTLPSVVRRYGYKTGGFFPPAVFYIDKDRFSAFQSSMFDFEYVKFEFIDAERRVDQVLAFLKESRGQKFFVWVHFFEPHEPYDPQPGFDFGPRAMDRYDGEIAYTDRAIGRLLKRVQAEHPTTVVALTGDHGEAFGEHREYYHGSSLYDEQVRVPVIVRVPGVAPLRVPGAAQSIDLAVTMLAAADIPVPAEMQGNDLGPWVAGEDAMRLPAVFSQFEQRKAVVRGQHKLIHNAVEGFSELYDLRADPGERVNLAARRPELLARLHGELRALGERDRRSGAREDRAAEAEGVLERGRQGDPSAIPSLIKLVRSGREVRREAVRLLTRLRAQSARAVLVDAARDPDPGVAIQATIGAALLGHPESLRQVPRLLERADLPPALRRDALLAQALAGDRRLVPRLIDLLVRSEDIYERIELIEILGQLRDDRATPALRQQLKTLRTRRHAIHALGLCRAHAAVPELVHGLQSDRFISWRQHAALALGRIGDARAVQPLQHLVRTELEPAVVAYAVEALGRLHALPIPGLAAVAAGPARCAADGCRVPLRAACGSPQELLVLLSGKPGRVTVTCGETVVGELDFPSVGAEPRVELPPVPSLVVSLAGHRGALELRTTGVQAPELVFAAVRPSQGRATASR